MAKYFTSTKFFDRNNVKLEIQSLTTYSRFLKINGRNKLQLFSPEEFINDSLEITEITLNIDNKEYNFSFNNNSFYKLDYEYKVVLNSEEILSLQIIKNDKFNIYFTPLVYGNHTIESITIKLNSLSKPIEVSLPILLDFELLPIDIADITINNKLFKKTGLQAPLNNVEGTDSIHSSISFSYKGLDLTKPIELSYIKFINKDTQLEEQVKVENSLYSIHSKYCSFSFEKLEKSASFVFHDFISRNDFTIRVGLKQNSIIKDIELVSVNILRVPIVSKISISDFKILENSLATIVLGTPLEIKSTITGGYGTKTISWKIDGKEVTKNTEKLVVKYLPKDNSVVSFTCADLISTSTDSKIIYTAKESKFNVSLNKYLFTSTDTINLNISKLNFVEFPLFSNSLYKFMNIKIMIDDTEYLSDKVVGIDFNKSLPYSIFTKGVHTISVRVSDLFGSYNDIITFEIK